MATISDCRAIYGLSALGTPTSTGVDGTVTLGVTQTTQRLADSDVAYSVRAIFAGISDTLSLNLLTGSTSGSTAWVAGVAQVETATVTAASGITGSGNATVTVTATGMDGSPKAISVALTTTAHTTATLIATAIAAALNADTDYSAYFTATSSGANVITTRKPTSTFTVTGGTLNIYAANISDLNIAIANGTCTGITTEATSTNTTAGVASAGVKIYDGDGKDFEGVTLTTISTIRGLLFVSNSDSVDYQDVISDGATFKLGVGSIVQFVNPSVTVDYSTFSVVAQATGDMTIHIIGEA